MEKEERAIILDFLQNGYPLEQKRMPVAQAIGIQHLTLLELIPRKGMALKLKEEVYIGPEKRDKIYFIKGKLPQEKLTETAKYELLDFIKRIIEEREAQFVEFFNNADAINTRLHQLELLPGLGKKFSSLIIAERENKKFKSFEDIKERIKTIPDPKKLVEKRLIEELTEKPRYKLFAS